MVWIEDKFKGRDDFPQKFELKNAYKDGRYRDDTIWQKEFKPNAKEPERSEMVEIANRFVSMAQTQCNEASKMQHFVILAINLTKSAYPYGLYYMTLRPNAFPSMGKGANGELAAHGLGDDEPLSDAHHRDGLMRNSLDFQKESNEHVRFVYDGMLKTQAQVFALQHEMINDLRSHNRALESQKLDWFKAMEESFSKKQEREMAAATHKLKMEAIERGSQFLLQMIPVVAKSLENRKNGAPALAANGMPAQITASAESMAVGQFVSNLNNEQKVALFGGRDELGNRISDGIFTMEQVAIFAQVGDLSAPASALDMLMPGAAHAISYEQVTAAQGVVPAEQFMPLYAILMERKKQQSADAEGPRA